MPKTVEVPILVEYSPETNTYRLWDQSQRIPHPPLVDRAEIFLNDSWEEMHFNKVWGKSYDPRKQGTWLKQKRSRHFSTSTGTKRVSAMVS